MNAIETHGLGKRYGRTWALRDCTLGIPAGRVVALVGPNGAGKTTLLQLAVGLIGLTTGQIAVLDGAAPGSSEALDGIAFVAQDTPLYNYLSVADTLRLVSSLANTWDEARARARLDALGIPLSRKVGKLSGGQRAQVALAVALARHPRLLILDEPVAELDPLARHDFMSTLMEAVAADGVSVVFSSHVLSELERVCDYLVLLSRGSVQIAGTVDDLVASHWVFIGPVDQADRHHTVPGPVRRLSGPAPLEPMGLLPAEQLVLALPDRRGLRLRHPRHPARRRDRVGPATPSGLSAHRCGRRLGRQPRRGMSR